MIYEKSNNNGSGVQQEPPPTSNGKNPWHVDGVELLKRARSSRHLLRNPLGWSIDTQTIEWALDNGIESIVIEDIEAKVTYKTSIQQIVDLGQVIDRGYGEQICLPLKHWEVDE